MDASPETLAAVFGEERVKNDMLGICRFMTEHPDEYHKKVWDYYAKRKNENVYICRECGGKCCMHVPCHFAPEDFEDLSYRALKKLLIKKKYISVIRFSKRFVELKLDEPIGGTLRHFYILRIRTSGTGIAARAAEIEDDDFCMLLGKNGCALEYEARPKGARMLIPKWEANCEQLYNMDDCVHDWIPYQGVLEKLYNFFEKRQRVKESLRKIIKRVHL